MDLAPDLRSSFLLDPGITYLNHGSFGACPRPVFDVYQAWQRRLEREPVQFLGMQAAEHLGTSRRALAEYVGCPADNLVYFPNPTTAVNMVARSLDLNPGDEILTTDHEYGAMDRTWRFTCQRTGAKLVRQSIPLPLDSPVEFVEHMWSGVTARTRVVFLSHITSQTALTFSVADICALAREAGILAIVDGAHAPGQVPLDLDALGADIYTGACHKWLCAPKGSAFLYARPQVQPMLHPLVVSWGWESDKPSTSTFIDHHEWQGTRDLAAFLSVPAAITFQREHNWPAVWEDCHHLAVQWRARLNQVLEQDPICEEGTFHQMFTVRFPVPDPENFQRRLYDDWHIEVPIFRWKDATWMRVSVQAYNGPDDFEALLDALEALL
jgi:isopenicillin-N epimerase